MRLTGRAATRAALLNALSAHGLVHLAGHGLLIEADPWSAGPALADESRLSLPDILGWRPDARLVVLSSGETGPDSGLEDDTVSLPAVFLAAGAATVFASDRQVDDVETARFFGLFYESPETPETPSSALRRTATTASGGLGLTFPASGRC